MKKLIFLFILIAVAKANAATNPNAHSIMRYQCGACHSSRELTANSKALSIFDLDQPNWIGKLSLSQKDEIIKRLRDRITMSDVEVSYLMPKGWQPLPKRPTERELQAVQNTLL